MMPQEKLINMYLVHPDRLWREAMVRALTRFKDVLIVGETAQRDSTDWLSGINLTGLDVLLLDFNSPSRSGLVQARQIVCSHPELQVLMTGVPDSDKEIISTIEAGAAGYMTRESSFNDLISNIRALASERTMCSKRVTRLLFSLVANSARANSAREPEHSAQNHLTPRELQVMTLIEEGLSNKGIARRLSIEQQTVKNHVHHILVKLSLHRRTEVARYVRQNQLTMRV